MTTTETLPRPTAESRGPSSLAATRRAFTTMAAAKIRESHRDRLAVVYVRQSTPQQVVEHRESLQRQYGLSDHAVGLGWSSERILVIDEDLGISGRTIEARKRISAIARGSDAGSCGDRAGVGNEPLGTFLQRLAGLL